jgi:hypothetical protein
MRDFFKSVLMAGAPFGFMMGIFFIFVQGFYLGTISSIFTGVIFGLIMGIFILIQKKKALSKAVEITKGKTILMNGAANHFLNKESVGGWMYLTVDEIIFKSHSANIQVHKTIIPLAQIIQVKAVMTVGIIPNGLLIVTKGGKEERFVVNDRNRWIESLICVTPRLK